LNSNSPSSLRPPSTDGRRVDLDWSARTPADCPVAGPPVLGDLSIRIVPATAGARIEQHTLPATID
jgi:hypothetical protein